MPVAHQQQTKEQEVVVMRGEKMWLKFFLGNFFILSSEFNMWESNIWLLCDLALTHLNLLLGCYLFVESKTI